MFDWLSMNWTAKPSSACQACGRVSGWVGDERKRENVQCGNARAMLLDCSSQMQWLTTRWWAAWRHLFGEDCRSLMFRDRHLSRHYCPIRGRKSHGRANAGIPVLVRTHSTRILMTETYNGMWNVDGKGRSKPFGDDPICPLVLVGQRYDIGAFAPCREACIVLDLSKRRVAPIDPHGSAVHLPVEREIAIGVGRLIDCGVQLFKSGKGALGHI